MVSGGHELGQRHVVIADDGEIAGITSPPDGRHPMTPMAIMSLQTNSAVGRSGSASRRVMAAVLAQSKSLPIQPGLTVSPASCIACSKPAWRWLAGARLWGP